MIQFFNNLFSVLIYFPFLNLLTVIIWGTPGHYAAVGIVILTLLVRFALLAPSKKAAQAQRKIMQLQPLLNDLKEEYKDDPRGMQLAQFELYKKNGINPLGSCLLTFVQLPILIILYHTIRDGLVVGNPNIYSWIPRPEFINTKFFWVDLLQTDHLLIIPILAAVLQFMQVRMTMPKAVPVAADGTPDPTAQAQRMSMFLLPLLTLFFARSLPAGIGLYWIVTTLFSIVQQYFVNKEKFNIAGVKEVMSEADKKHPEHHRSKAVEKEISEETSTAKGGVSVTVRRKKK